MEIVTVDIILPVKNRDTVTVVVETIINAIRAAERITLGQIILCDGGSTESVCLSQIAAVDRYARVRVLRCNYLEFNKGQLINRGLAETTAEIVLISDIDILWKSEALDAIALCAFNYRRHICSVLDVRESDPTAKAVRRKRYTYKLERKNSLEAKELHTRIEICDASLNDDKRPGCGIVCAQKSVFKAIGGYKECFVGWGWEDQDLLIRAQLLGYQVLALGEVTHLSHGDERRSLTESSIEASRDRNIARCLNGLLQKRFVGDFPGNHAVYTGTLSVRYPSELEPRIKS